MDDPSRQIVDLHRQYAGVIFDKCLRMLGGRAEAEDAVQQTFLNAFRSLDSFTHGESHLPWLYRIATNVCLKILRKRRRGEVFAERIPEVATGPDQRADAFTHYRQLMERIVEGLDQRGQQIFVAHYVDGMNQGQIAENLGISRRAVVKRLTALRARLDPVLAEAGQ